MSKPRVILVSLHYLQSRRRAGFHWLAEAYHRLGWDVTFVTVALSWLSWLRRDHRFRYPVRREANRLKPIAPGLESFVWLTPWHPANLRRETLNRLAGPWFRRYGRRLPEALETRVRAADLVLFESTPGLLLFERFKALNPTARMVYRASDDLQVLQNHPVVLEAERRFGPQFDLISVPTAPMLERLGRLGRAALHHHGVRKELFDAELPSPYDDRWRVNAVFVGKEASRVAIDARFFEVACRCFPDWGFHVLGDLRCLPKAENLQCYGERPFAETVPYLRHADVGLQPRRYVPGAEAVGDSLKMVQYTYCRLPIVAPRFVVSDRPNLIRYDLDDERSIRDALAQARTFDRARIDVGAIQSWEQLAQTLAGIGVSAGEARAVPLPAASASARTVVGSPGDGRGIRATGPTVGSP